MCTLTAAQIPGARADEWQVSRAPVRFTLKLTRAPSTASAGYIARLPDGGLLPRPKPAVTVLDAAGGKRAHGCLWYDPASELILVFDGPASGDRVFVYLEPAHRLKSWTEASGLTPGTLAYMVYRGKGIEDARAVARDFPPGRNVYFDQVPGLSLAAIPYGLDGAFADYLIGFTAGTNPGRTWISPQTQNGARMEVLVGGKPVVLTRAFDKPGGVGTWFDLPQRPVKVELFGYRPRKRGRFQVTWRPPGTPASELAADAAHPDGALAARPVRPAECVQSGSAGLVEVRLRDGAPVALARATAEGYFWFAECPVVLYRLAARTEDNPADTTYRWSPAPGASIEGETDVLWLYEAGFDHTFSLAASAGGRTRTATYSGLSYCAPQKKSNMGSAEVCERYRNAFLTMFRAFESGQDPTASWSPSLWDLFWRLAEPGRNAQLLAQLFTRHWDTLRGKLSQKERWRLQDLFLDMGATADPNEAVQWLSRFEGEETDPVRLKELRIRRIELLMYDLDEPDAARTLASALAEEDSVPGRLALVRLGDLAFLDRQYDEATRWYGRAQDRALPAPVRPAAARRAPLPARGLARSREELKRQIEARRLPIRPGPDVPDRDVPADWRREAVRSTAMSETARSLIRQGYRTEAETLLREWELELPLSKISSDYFIVEAELRMARGEYGRAERILTAYCGSVEMTAFLPEAMRKKLDCMMRLGRPDGELREFVVEMKERFPYHPLAREAENMLSILSEDRGVREPTRDRTE